MKRKALSILLAALMLCSLLPATALAAGTTEGGLTVEGTSGTDYTYADHVLTIKAGKSATVSGKTSEDTILVENGATLTLAGVDISITVTTETISDSPIKLASWQAAPRPRSS